MYLKLPKHRCLVQPFQMGFGSPVTPVPHLPSLLTYLHYPRVFQIALYLGK